MRVILVQCFSAIKISSSYLALLIIFCDNSTDDIFLLTGSYIFQYSLSLYKLLNFQELSIEQGPAQLTLTRKKLTILLSMIVYGPKSATVTSAINSIICAELPWLKFLSHNTNLSLACSELWEKTKSITNKPFIIATCIHSLSD